MNTLIIDTTSNKIIKVGLRIGNKTELIEQEINTQKAQVVLPLLEKLLSKHKIKLTGIENIEVNTRPGSFTGIRVGIASANALAFALKIPVSNGKVV